MKKILLFLLLSLSISTAYSQKDIKTNRDSLVYTPVRLMKYMVSELGECDSIRNMYNELLADHEYTMDYGEKMLEYYEDTLAKLSTAYNYQKEFSDIQIYNLQNAESQLNNCTKYQKERNAWRIIAGVVIIVGTIININHE